jgi:hypothetical protein
MRDETHRNEEAAMTVQNDLLALERRLWTGGADDYREIPTLTA